MLVVAGELRHIRELCVHVVVWTESLVVVVVVGDLRGLREYWSLWVAHQRRRATGQCGLVLLEPPGLAAAAAVRIEAHFVRACKPRMVCQLLENRRLRSVHLCVRVRLKLELRLRLQLGLGLRLGLGLEIPHFQVQLHVLLRLRLRLRRFRRFRRRGTDRRS